MAGVLARLSPGGSAAILSLLLAIYVWLSPFDPETLSTKAQVAVQLLDMVMVPLISTTGKTPLLAALCGLAVVGISNWLGLRWPAIVVPALPPMRAPRRAEIDDAPVAATTHSRKRALGQMSERGAQAAGPTPEHPAQPIAGSQQIPAIKLGLSGDVEQHAWALANEWEHGTAPQGERVDPIAIIRKRREKSRDWSLDRSWFGGLPRLGKAPWPRDEKGVPLPFVAQLDLAEIAAANPDTPLPKAGSLAFFINSGAVLHVPPGDHPPTSAPDDLPPAYQEDGYPLPETRSPTTHKTFPFWPVEPHRLRLPANLPAHYEKGANQIEIEQAQNAALGQIAARREFFFSTGDKLTEGVAGADSMWWYGAGLVHRQLQAALDSLPAAIAMREKWIAEAQAHQARLAAAPEPDKKKIEASEGSEARNRASIPLITEQGGKLADFLDHFEAFIAGRDPWEEMAAGEVQVLADAIQAARRDFPDLCRYNVSFGINEVRNACFRHMMTGDAAAAAAIPDAVLALLNESYRLPTVFSHQMFGLGGCRQDALFVHVYDHLLLQIVFDDLPEFRFGDMGLWQFWISAENLAAGKWDEVELTFEGA